MKVQVTITENTATSTKIEQVVEVQGRMKAPVTDETISLGGDRKILDYGHINMLLCEKYGAIRGENSYQGLADMGNRMWTVAQKIQREKLSMMRALGKYGDPDNHAYQGLYQLYFTAQEKAA